MTALLAAGVPLAFIAVGSEGANIPLSMLIVFGSAKLLAEAFERLHQPGIVGEILAGVLIGPSVLGWITPNEFIHALADIGVMFLLFRVGLEVKASELLRVGGVALLVANLGVAIPFFLGWGILLLWGSSQVQAIFVGAVMVATSVGITAQVLSDKGLLHEKSSKIILAAAVIDDVLGLLLLALVSSVARGSVNILGLIMTGLLAFGFVVFIAKWGHQTFGRVVAKVQQKLRLGEAYFALAMVMLFGLAVLAMYTGVAAIVGAFLAGMALSESVNPRVEDLAQGVTELLVPFFLAGIGMNLNVRTFTDPGILALAGLILVAAILSKFIGCGLGAYSLGWEGAIQVGVGMVPRGEVGMVVAQIGLALGVVTQPVYGVAVAMAVLTTVVAPPLLKLAYRNTLQAEPPAEEVFRIG